ncbi:MAG: hypothetical protein K6A62_07875 [Bacteroidales bacterium]|nr:hypothetical protein [Bacteroidales bacterium]
MRNKKLNYTAPAVINDLVLELEAEILGASVVTEETVVETKGQEIETHDFTDSSFNQTWE